MPPKPVLNEAAIKDTTDGANGTSPDARAEKISKPCFDAIVEHWFKARIDGPMQTLTHYDETVKQLITLGGLLPAILVAAYKLFSQPMPSLLEMLTKPSTAKPTLVEVLKQPSTILFALFVVCFCVFIFFLIKACARRLETAGPTKSKPKSKPKPKPRSESCEVYKLLEHAAEGSLSPEQVSSAVKDWSKDVDNLIRYKHRWVKWASIMLTASTLLLMFLLFASATGLV